jgi:hypothetical protein
MSIRASSKRRPALKGARDLSDSSTPRGCTTHKFLANLARQRANSSFTVAQSMAYALEQKLGFPCSWRLPSSLSVPTVTERIIRHDFDSTYSALNQDLPRTIYRVLPLLNLGLEDLKSILPYPCGKSDGCCGVNDMATFISEAQAELIRYA